MRVAQTGSIERGGYGRPYSSSSWYDTSIRVYVYLDEQVFFFRRSLWDAHCGRPLGIQFINVSLAEFLVDQEIQGHFFILKKTERDHMWFGHGHNNSSFVSRNCDYYSYHITRCLSI